MRGRREDCLKGWNGLELAAHETPTDLYRAENYRLGIRGCKDAIKHVSPL